MASKAGAKKGKASSAKELPAAQQSSDAADASSFASLLSKCPVEFQEQALQWMKMLGSDGPKHSSSAGSEVNDSTPKKVYSEAAIANALVSAKLLCGHSN